MESDLIMHAEEDDTKIFGFWLYLMTDLICFAVLFAVFLVLHNSTSYGPSGRELFHLSFVLKETLILLTSSFTCSLATLSVHRKQKKWTFFWFFVTLVLGILFLFLEISEFSMLLKQGAGPERSAFLSSFFTLVGTHGLHIFAGLLWMSAALFRVWIRSLSAQDVSRMFRLAFFWHFLDVVWVFIFTVVYGLEFIS